MNLMVPVLAAYIAESIGKRPALVPGFVAGMIAIQGLPVNPATGLIDAGGAGVGFGFLGGIVGGILFTAFKKAEWTKAQREATAEVAVNDAPAPVDATAEAAEAPAEVPVDADDSEGFVKDSDVLSATDLDRDGALKAITAHAVEAGIASDSDALLAAFLKRESEGTTGMVDGYAIPHAKTDAVVRPAVVVLKAADGVAAWDTMDGAPVTCAIALLVPESQAGTAHLQILSKVATALTDDVFRAACKAEDDPAKVAGLINERLA